MMTGTGNVETYPLIGIEILIDGDGDIYPAFLDILQNPALHDACILQSGLFHPACKNPACFCLLM